jgi:hypothetical protein
MGFKALANVNSNIPIPRMRGTNNNWEPSIKTTEIRAVIAPLKPTKLAVCGEHNIALRIRIHHNSVPAVQIKS